MEQLKIAKGAGKKEGIKVVIIGGHLAPALSVIEALPKNANILFVGRKYSLEGDNALSLEYRTITARKIPFIGLNTGRLQRRVTKYTVFSLLKLPIGIVKSFLILTLFRPDVVLGFGGYVSIPVCICAFLLRIPIIIHEQTLEAGLSNRLISGMAKKICISWNTSRQFFPAKKTVLTGNPIRKFYIMGTKFSIFSNNLPIIYITGGSSGSHILNILTEGMVEDLLSKYNVIHQVGDAQEFRDFDRLEKIRKNLPENIRDNYILQKLIDPSQIGDIINISTLVISRAGINTITELVNFEKPAILIPLPFSQKNEQHKNAKFFESIGLGLVLNQSETNETKLRSTIEKMIKNIKKYKINEENSNILGGKNAAHNILSVVSNVYFETKKKRLW